MTDVPRTIARVLLREARAAGEIEPAMDDLSLLVRISADPEVQRFLNHPRIPAADKESVLGRWIQNGLVRRLLNALLAARATGLLPAIHAGFSLHVRRESGFVEAIARVAQPVSPTQEDELRLAVQAATGMIPLMKVQVDPQLIGGVRLTIDGRVADNSLKTELERLKERLQAQ
jgi:F-type H+-transporting ATPase subunit delta